MVQVFSFCLWSDQKKSKDNYGSFQLGLNFIMSVWVVLTRWLLEDVLLHEAADLYCS